VGLQAVVAGSTRVRALGTGHSFSRIELISTAGLPPDAVRARYPRWDDFRALARSLDPAGKFRNDFMDTYFPSEDLPGGR
jgi:hypothetical protein